MALSKEEIIKIEDVLKASLRNKFQNYNPEPASMPFHTRLLGKDRLALYSFIHSLNTNFGTSIFEPVALALAQKHFKTATAQATAGKQISTEAQKEIQKIIDGLTTATTSPHKIDEIEKIRKVCQKGEMITVKPTKVDLMFESKTGEYFLFDIKTAKPNAGGFKEFKRTLLEWVAVILADNPKAEVSTFIAIPYNPYEPEPYTRWTMRGMLDLENELKVADEFWDFLGGKNTYKDLLDCFERVGIELRGEIDDYFKHFNKK
ncbi:MAG: TdeIII family type II restriction endonuclease [Candidatus Gracilibacteria bacterium]|jgi:type II restriction enzyme